MKFKLTREYKQNANNEVISFSGEISMSDLLDLKLNPLDRKLLNDVGGDAGASPADHLLLLEMLFRCHDQSLAARSSALKLA